MTLKNLIIIIVDEVSMVSNLNLAYLHMCLEDIFGTDEWFGSKNILFVGGLLQLPPDQYLIKLATNYTWATLTFKSA